MGSLRDHRGMSLRAHLACEMAKALIIKQYPGEGVDFSPSRFGDKECCDAHANAAVMLADAILARLTNE